MCCKCHLPKHLFWFFFFPLCPLFSFKGCSRGGICKFTGPAYYLEPKVWARLFISTIFKFCHNPAGQRLWSPCYKWRSRKARALFPDSGRTSWWDAPWFHFWKPSLRNLPQIWGKENKKISLTKSPLQCNLQLWKPGNNLMSKFIKMFH
jgi:hypothetical protein